ncbi:MAG: hypothetical protein QOG67_2618, partial [Verrucomicrobiota bacterium]
GRINSHPQNESFEISLRQIGGGMGIRTPGLVIANDALYQLSYTPEMRAETITIGRFFSK